MPCSRCGRTACGCTSVGVGAPKPYYKQPDGVVTPENHIQHLLEPRYSAAIQIANDWNIPLVGQTTILDVPSLDNVLVSAYLFNESYGFFQVMGYNDQTKQLVIVNSGIQGNQTPGSYVPACTNFIFAPPPCCTTDDETPYPYVAEDFVVPEVGDSVTVKVTSVATLSIGSLYHIGDQIYQLDAIGSGRTITITTQAGGPAAGELIQAKDVDGFFQYPLSAAATEACDASAASEITLLGCASGIERLLDAGGVDQVPVVTNASTNTVRMKYLDTTPRVCTNTSTLLTLTNGQTTIASLQVSSTVGFTLGDVLQINFGTLRYTITNVIDGTHLALSIDPAATAQSISTGAFVCLILSSELILADVLDLTTSFNDYVDGQKQTGADDTVDSSDTATLNGGSPAAYPLTMSSNADEVLGHAIDITVQNDSATLSMFVLLNMDLRLSAYFDKPGAGNDYGYVELALQGWQNTGTIGSVADPVSSLADDGPVQRVFVTNDTAYENSTPIDFSMHAHHIYLLTPGQQIKLACRGRVKRISASQAIVVEDLWMQASLLGYALA